MFVSFFPRPKWFFWSVLLWTALAIGVWYAWGRAFGAHFGLPPAKPGAPPIIGLQRFWSPPFLWFYIYYVVFAGAFAAFWQAVAPHPWWRWSILGSALIALLTYIQVQCSVAINAWNNTMFSLVQVALNRSGPVTMDEFNKLIWLFLTLAFLYITIGVFVFFFSSHFVFRWRTAMNSYYMSHWGELRLIEGAAQRVQEDTMRFSTITEELGVSFVNSLMTLIAFLPVLMSLSVSVKVLPFVGAVPNSLVWAALVWSAFGTGLLMIAGVKLPGLNFRIQRVEAAYRKELVYGEDDPARAEPPTIAELFSRVRKNYFTLYFHYLYFNLARIFYLQVDSIFSLMILAPSLLAGTLTLGLFSQISDAFQQVSSSFQYLVNSWSTIVELQSIHKRLRGFESQMHGQRLSAIEQEPASA